MIKINRIIAGMLTLAAMMGSAVECRAVSDREMEEARTIAAKAYLRYANNGSGYLDEVNARSISELQKSLKAKEKENIKAFLAIPVPKDYATWDKTRLVEYWGSTAFKAAGLIEEGKGARPRVRKQIMAMSVSAPSAAAAAEAPAEAAPAPAEAAPAEASVAEQPAEAAAADPAAQQADILADQKAIEDDAKNAAPESQNSGSNATWIYVVILCVLIGVVVWLVTFAAKVMNRQPDAAGKNDDEAEEVRAKARQAIASYKEKLAAHEDVERELKAREQEHVRREQQLLARIADLEEKLRKAETRSYREAAPAPAPVQPAPAPVRPKPAPEQEEILHVIYLGRANSRGIFVRADRRLSPGNTIYRLDTEDGLVGTFHVVDNPAVTAIALEHPLEMLSGGCSAIDIEDTVGATSIVTESSGTAIFENGYWKVLRKSSIRYE
jgi:hypothetical protein